MRDRSRLFVFYRTYEMASLVEYCASIPESFGEIDWADPDIVKSLYVPSKISLLHHYTYAMISVEERGDLRKNDDIYEESLEERRAIEKALEAYAVDYLPYEAFLAGSTTSEVGGFPFRDWVLSQEANFELLWEKMADEVFHLLFANRAFLLQFNQSLAHFLASGNVVIPTAFLDGKGVIQRMAHRPKWVDRAVFYRDQGRCVFCQRDLTGLLSTEHGIHYDHIVPLKLWGTNDPCNLQLLCESCNLSKSGGAAQTATRYPLWWDY